MGLDADGMNWIVSEDEAYVPLYEAKMIHQFDHRWTTFDAHSKSFRNVTTEEKKEHEFEATPRYWVSEKEVAERLRRVGWTRSWLMGWRDITNVTNERTVISTIFPRSAINDKILIVISEKEANFIVALCANLISLPLDYVARQKIGGTSLKYYYLKQLPVLPPEAYDQRSLKFIISRTLELLFTSNMMQPIARDVGYEGAPFQFDPERRAILRAELDAFYGQTLRINAR